MTSTEAQHSQPGQPSQPAQGSPAVAAEPLPPAPRPPLTQARIETMISRAIVLFGLVFGVLVIPTLIAQQAQLRQPLGWTQAAALCLCLIWAAIATIVERAVSLATTSLAVLYLLIVALWPTTAAGTHVDGTPWLWTLCTVAASYAAVGMQAWIASVYVLLAPALFGVVLWQVTAGRAWGTALLDALYAAIVGSVILTIASLLRSAAGAVDSAQRAALAGYERGVREHLGEAERVEVDALVHDSVLTTLLAAANARTPEAQRLAARMARDALGHLSSMRPAPTAMREQLTDAWSLIASIRNAASSIPHEPLFSTQGPLAASLPESAAEALHAATVQAMLNSSQHAGGAAVARLVAFTGVGQGGTEGVRIRISDDGVGFDVEQVAPRRLGLTTSIVQRVEVVGGAARIESAPGRGTEITLTWPAPAESGAAEDDGDGDDDAAARTAARGGDEGDEGTRPW